MKILIADDDRIFRRLLTAMLGEIGIEPIVARDGEEAWEKIQEIHEPMLAILDWNMPGITGPDLCFKIRTDRIEEHYCYLILLTGRDKHEDRINGLASGADDYMVKPFDSIEMRARIRTAQRVIDLQSALIKLNADLEQTVAERTAEVERLLAQKDQFVNQLGHDLKTPLTPLMALLPRLAKVATDERSRETLDLLIENVHYMNDLVQGTLSLASLNSSSVELHMAPLDLHSEVRFVTESLGTGEAASDVVVESCIEEGIWVGADRVMLRELLSNLVGNSIKFCESGDSVAVSAAVAGNEVTVTVADTGIGMDEEQRSLIFNEFYKADSSRNDRGSVGIGLSICKRIAELHGGRIWFESEGLGKGTSAHFTMTVASPEAIGSAESENCELSVT